MLTTIIPYTINSDINLPEIIIFDFVRFNLGNYFYFVITWDRIQIYLTMDGMFLEKIQKQHTIYTGVIAKCPVVTLSYEMYLRNN